MDVTFVDIDQASDIDSGVAVVVDVLRAFTVAAWAFHLVADHIILVDDLETAVELADSRTLLFKDGAPDDRFHLHNSPHQLKSLHIDGKRIIQRTNAGTRAAMAARGASEIMCASFVCATATASALAASGQRGVTFVVSGGLDADEDMACAEFIAAVDGHLVLRPTSPT